RQDEEGSLEGILRVVPAKAAPAQPQHQRAVPGEDLGKGRLVATGREPLQELGVRQWGRLWDGWLHVSSASCHPVSALTPPIGYTFSAPAPPRATTNPCAFSKGTPGASTRWPSRPTAGTWSRPAATRRPGCGTPPPGPRSRATAPSGSPSSA